MDLSDKVNFPPPKIQPHRNLSLKLKLASAENNSKTKLPTPNNDKDTDKTETYAEKQETAKAYTISPQAVVADLNESLEQTKDQHDTHEKNIEQQADLPDTKLESDNATSAELHVPHQVSEKKLKSSSLKDTQKMLQEREEYILSLIHI